LFACNPIIAISAIFIIRFIQTFHAIPYISQAGTLKTILAFFGHASYPNTCIATSNNSNNKHLGGVKTIAALLLQECFNAPR